VVKRHTRVAERRSDFFRLKFITACLVIVSYRVCQGLCPPRLRTGEGFALNASTSYRLRLTVLHTEVTIWMHCWRTGKRATAVCVIWRPLVKKARPTANQQYAISYYG